MTYEEFIYYKTKYAIDKTTGRVYEKETNKEITDKDLSIKIVAIHTLFNDIAMYYSNKKIKRNFTEYLKESIKEFNENFKSLEEYLEKHNNLKAHFMKKEEEIKELKNKLDNSVLNEDMNKYYTDRLHNLGEYEKIGIFTEEEILEYVNKYGFNGMSVYDKETKKIVKDEKLSNLVLAAMFIYNEANEIYLKEDGRIPLKNLIISESKKINESSLFNKIINREEVKELINYNNDINNLDEDIKNSESEFNYLTGSKKIYAIAYLNTVLSAKNLKLDSFEVKAGIPKNNQGKIKLIVDYRLKSTLERKENINIDKVISNVTRFVNTCRGDFKLEDWSILSNKDKISYFNMITNMALRNEKPELAETSKFLASVITGLDTLENLNKLNKIKESAYIDNDEISYEYAVTTINKYIGELETNQIFETIMNKSNIDESIKTNLTNMIDGIKQIADDNILEEDTIEVKEEQEEIDNSMGRYHNINEVLNSGEQIIKEIGHVCLSNDLTIGDIEEYVGILKILRKDAIKFHNYTYANQIKKMENRLKDILWYVESLSVKNEEDLIPLYEYKEMPIISISHSKESDELYFVNNNRYKYNQIVRNIKKDLYVIKAYSVMFKQKTKENDYTDLSGLFDNDERKI